jgi:hypothetical protein
MSDTANLNNVASDAMIEKVRKLLALAESAAKVGNMAEADAATEFATKLITKFGIDQALLAAKGEIKDELINKRIKIADDWALDRRSLLFAIVRGLGAKALYLKTKRPGTQQSYSYVMHVFAYESDMARIEFLFEMLQPQMILGAAAAESGTWWENKRSFRKSWMAGFSTAIAERLQRNTKEAATEAGTGTDIVLFDRSKAVESAYTTRYPKTVSTSRNLAGSGRSQGYAAGQRASLGDNQIGGSRLALAR